ATKHRLCCLSFSLSDWILLQRRKKRIPYFQVTRSGQVSHGKTRQTNKRDNGQMDERAHRKVDMEVWRTRGSFQHRSTRSGDGIHASIVITLLIGVWCAQALEVSVGKVSSVEVMNGSSVLLPCTYSSCIGIKNLYFNWKYNDNGTLNMLCEGVVPAEGLEPHVMTYHDRVMFVGSSKDSNISVVLSNVTFEDEGEYICFARNPKEKNRNHSAIFNLYVVEQ
ncbi:sodium channel subunit beta-4-like, partial [Clarias magur]